MRVKQEKTGLIPGSHLSRQAIFRCELMLLTTVKAINPLKSLVHLDGETSNTLFETLEEWERYLAQLYQPPEYLTHTSRPNI
jgi:hypothetical protein